MKSPSDTTLYVPAINKGGGPNQKAINQISAFVEGIRLETDRKQDEGTSGPSSPATRNQPSGAHGSDFPVDHLNPDVERAIIQAEKFKVNSAPPKGNVQFNFTPSMVDNDDDFFHIMCHVDRALREKIGRGEFIDLEKLLPKEGGGQSGEGKRMELITKNGQTYFSPVQDKTTRISGLQKWEQAFRVYGAIYSQAQPHMATEVWQYLYVINHAANSFHWDNVAHYDFMFRQLMAMKPGRSWVKTYHQGWSLAMTDPINKSNSALQAGNSRTSPEGGRSWRDKCCWRYNRNKCGKPAASCDWDHHCTYCSGWNHDYHNCRKRLNKAGGTGSTQSGKNQGHGSQGHSK